MKALLTGAMVLAVAAAIAGQADYASPRTSQSADALKRATTRLTERAMQDVMRTTSNSRTDLQDAMLAQQADAGAMLLVEMVRNRRPSRELREVVTMLTDLSRRVAPYSPRISLWRPVQSAVADLDRELNGNPPGPGPTPGPPERPIVGRVSWRGVVDDRVQLVIRGNSVEVRTITGVPQKEGVSVFTSPLPASPVSVDVSKVAGRGTVTVLQQPARTNDFTAVIEIFDRNSGEQEYRLDIFWR